MFNERLKAALRNFNLKGALGLSDEIHAFEAAGGEITETTDKLWEKLTVKIETARGNPMFV
jgi:hypothetical protein